MSPPPGGPEIVRVVLIEDSQADAALIAELLAEHSPGGFETTHVESLHAARRRLGDAGADCILLDLSLPDAEGLDGVNELLASFPEIPVVVLTGRADDELARAAVNAGAQDYLVKGGDAGPLARAIGHAIERRRATGRLARRALYDPLTGLPNRVLLTDRLRHAVARAGRERSCVAVLFIDLDGFKAVNDSLGHTAGDQLLVDVGARLRAAVRPGDTAGRMGGDEFVGICEQVQDEHGALTIARRVADTLRRAFEVGGRPVSLAPSIGVAVGRAGEGEPGRLLQQADTAMYLAKDSGRGEPELFDDRLSLQLLERVDLEEALGRALGASEFELLWQPIFDLSSGRAVAVEALLRWRHPEAGLLPAERFVHVAEESGLILPIGAWVLDRVCHQLAEWHRSDGDAPRLAVVNVSPAELLQQGFAPALDDLLGRTGIEPSSLELDIAERHLHASGAAGFAAADAVRQLGVRLALDDFGTGDSSLTLLRDLELTTVKIDATLVAGVADAADDAAFVGAIVSLSEKLGLLSTAEGIETQAQLETLRLIGCRQGQGSHLAEPQPAEGLARLPATREPFDA